MVSFLAVFMFMFMFMFMFRVRVRFRFRVRVCVLGRDDDNYSPERILPHA